VTTFSPNSVPSLAGPLSDPIGRAAIGPGATKRGCSCSHFQLSNTSPSSKKITPLWLACPGWSEEWGVIETRREEQRRLIWNTLAVASGHLSHYDSVQRTSQNLGITKPWNVGQPQRIVCFGTDFSSLLPQFKVFFPGERLFGTPQMRDDLAAKHSIWALYSRCYMLYTSCFSVHHDESISEYDKGQFAVQACLESERMEKMLNTHTCDLERASCRFSPFLSVKSNADGVVTP
jgi:hypothetical protein